MRWYRGLAICVLTLSAASGCTTAWQVKAEWVGGRLLFGASLKDTDADCIQAFEVSDQATGKVVWSIKEHPDSSGAELSPCQRRFPLEYGKTPTGFSTVVKPVNLQSGQIYSINGSASDPIFGRFRYTVEPQIENL